MKKAIYLLLGIISFTFIGLNSIYAACDPADPTCVEGHKGAGGRLYGPKSYYDVYNQLCPGAVGYIPMSVIIEMLKTQDNSLCEQYSSNTGDSDNDGTDGKDNDGDGDNINSDNDKDGDSNNNDDDTTIIIEPVVTDEMTNKHLYTGVSTTPTEAPFCVTCHSDDNGNTLYGKIILKDENGNLRIGVGKRKTYDENGNEIGEETTDYIYIEPEKLNSYLNETELEKCKQENQ